MPKPNTWGQRFAALRRELETQKPQAGAFIDSSGTLHFNLEFVESWQGREALRVESVVRDGGELLLDMEDALILRDLLLEMLPLESEENTDA